MTAKLMLATLFFIHQTNNMTETLHTGDNLEYMRTLPSESIDLIYSDILYGTGRDFGDYKDIKANRKDVEAFYIPRIKEMHRILKDTGSIYLQMDTRINHWLRCILDDIFGCDNFLNEIVWCYRKWTAKQKKYQKNSDRILFYTKTNNHVFNTPQVPKSEKTIKSWGLKKMKVGITKKTELKDISKTTAMPDYIYLSILNYQSDEYVDYSTQKPLELMKIFIEASSNEGDVCADFFAGSGSFGVASKKLNRNVILNDINPNAIKLCKQRLDNANDLFNCC